MPGREIRAFAKKYARVCSTAKAILTNAHWPDAMGLSDPRKPLVHGLIRSGFVCHCFGVFPLIPVYWCNKKMTILIKNRQAKS
jgi:hypothetical protein